MVYLKPSLVLLWIFKKIKIVEEFEKAFMRTQVIVGLYVMFFSKICFLCIITFVYVDSGHRCTCTCI